MPKYGENPYFDQYMRDTFGEDLEPPRSAKSHSSIGGEEFIKSAKKQQDAFMEELYRAAEEKAAKRQTAAQSKPQLKPTPSVETKAKAPVKKASNKNQDISLGLSNLSTGMIAALFCAILSPDVRQPFYAGNYLEWIQNSLLYALIGYFLFTIGYVVLNVVLGKADFMQKGKPWRIPVIVICTLLLYAFLFYIGSLIF